MKRIPALFQAALILAIMITTAIYCQASQPAPAKKTIAVAELMQETNSFSPVLTTRRDFEAAGLISGNDIIAYCRTKEKKGQIAGFLKAVDKFGRQQIRVVPILKARSMSGGPVKREVYEEFKKTIVAGLKSAGKVDGVYLSLHGAMGVEGMRDPEGDLLSAVRAVTGDQIPIGVTHDLHANLTRKRMKLMTFLVGYHTNPHRDFSDVGCKAGEILIKTLQGKIKPVMAYNKMRLLKGGGMNIDFLSPMRPIFRWMKKQEKADNVLWLSNFMVHIWLDDPELGWSTVAVTDNGPRLAQKLADELAKRDWAVRAAKHPAGHSPAEAIAIARSKWLRRKFGTVVFCDVSDAVGAGAPGESTWILKALLEQAPDLTSYLTIRDARAAMLAFNHQLGEQLTLTVGGKLDHVYNRPLVYTGQLIYKGIAPQGKTVILKHQGIHLILSELADSLYSPGYFKNLGLSLWKADIVVVKNLFPFRYRYLLYNRKTVNVMTPGVTNVDVFALKYTRIPRPIYPLDPIDTWRAP